MYKTTDNKDPPPGRGYLPKRAREILQSALAKYRADKIDPTRIKHIERAEAEIHHLFPKYFKPTKENQK